MKIRDREKRSLFILILSCLSVTAHGEERLSEVEILNLSPFTPYTFPSEIEFSHLESGHKNALLDLTTAPLIHNNNFRSFFKRTPEIYLEEFELSGVNMNASYRGLPPNNALFTQVFVNDIPLNSDVFGTRFVTGLPDLNTISQVLIRTGGSGVSYGHGLGGVIHMQSYPTAGDQPYRLSSTSSVGSYQTITELFQASGTVDSMSYSLFGSYREGGGLAQQPAYDSASGGASIHLRLSEKDTIQLGYQHYRFSQDELPSLIQNVGSVDKLLNYYYQDVDKHSASLKWNHTFSHSSWLDSTNWFINTNGVRDISNAPSNIGRTEESIHYAGTQNRLTHRYDIGNSSNHILQTGFVLQGSVSPLETDGVDGIDIDRHELNAGVFVENKFQVTKRWSITPGLRVEYAEIAGDGVRDGQSVDRNFSDITPLFSLGTEMDILERLQEQRPLTLYANFSNAYRAPTYNDFVNRSPTIGLDEDLTSSESIQVEVGLRGSPWNWLHYDISGYWMEYFDQFAIVNDTVINEGTSTHYGGSLFTEVDLLALYDWAHPSDASDLQRFGQLYVFSGVHYLQVHIDETPFPGDSDHAPYAPDWTVKWGVEYNYFNRIKAALSMIYVSDHLGDTTNGNSLLYPSASRQVLEDRVVMDLSLQYTFLRDIATAYFGINNLLNTQYISSRRGGSTQDFIEAPGQNFYGGLRLSF
ncbi:MAG: TonB-dependent receptor [Verrucomicrobiota bacterium]